MLEWGVQRWFMCFLGGGGWTGGYVNEHFFVTFWPLKCVLEWNYQGSSKLPNYAFLGLSSNYSPVPPALELFLVALSIMSFFKMLQQHWKNAILKPSRSECHRWTPLISNCVYFYWCFFHVANNLSKCPFCSVLANVFIHYLSYSMTENFCPCYFVILYLY